MIAQFANLYGILIAPLLTNQAIDYNVSHKGENKNENVPC